jgi:protein Tex
VVRRILARAKTDIGSLIGNAPKLKSLPPREFVDERFGLPTVTDILAELEKPGRDPRPAFRTATFAEGVHKLSDLRPGMVLEGQVTNVAAFGAFVDVGVHQDGLVHVSAMSATFVSDPREVVKSGDVVRVKVLEVDEARKRISLTLRLDEEANAKPERGPRRDRPEKNPRKGADRNADRRGGNRDRRDTGRAERAGAPSNSAMADALRRAGLAGK